MSFTVSHAERVSAVSWFADDAAEGIVAGATPETVPGSAFGAVPGFAPGSTPGAVSFTASALAAKSFSSCARAASLASSCFARGMCGLLGKFTKITHSFCDVVTVKIF